MKKFFAVLMATSPDNRGEWQIWYWGMGCTSAKKFFFAVIVSPISRKFSARKDAQSHSQQIFISICGKKNGIPGMENQIFLVGKACRI